MTTASGKKKERHKPKRGNRKPQYLNPSDIPAELEQLFPDETIERIARDTEFIKRERIIHPVPFFWAIVLGYGTHLQRTLSGLRRTYETMSGEDIVASSWIERFTPALVKFLQGAVIHALQQTANDMGRVLNDKLKRFADILIFDNSVIRLHHALAKRFPATSQRKSSLVSKCGYLSVPWPMAPRVYQSTVNGPRISRHSVLDAG